jgi:hypothetical protein
MATAEPRSFRAVTRTCLPAAVALIVAGFGGWERESRPPLERLAAQRSRLAGSLFNGTARLMGAIRAFGKPTSLRRGRLAAAPEPTSIVVRGDVLGAR